MYRYTEHWANIKLEANADAKRVTTVKLTFMCKKGKTFYQMLKKKTIRTKSQDDMEFLCSHFKQNIPYPHIATDNVFNAGSFGCLFSVFSQQKMVSDLHLARDRGQKRSKWGRDLPESPLRIIVTYVALLFIVMSQ